MVLRQLRRSIKIIYLLLARYLNFMGGNSMEYSTAKEVYQKLNAATKGDEDAEMLYRDLVKLAVDYARRRTDWQLSDIETRIKMDEARTMVHDAFIGSCNSLS